MSKIKIPQSKVGDVDKLVSKKLKMRRIFLGLSQIDLAKAANVSIQQIQKYEKAVNRISSGRLYALAKFLKVPIDYFFDELNINTNEVVETFSANKDDNKKEDLEKVSEAEIIKLIKAYTSIADEKIRRKFMELIRLVSDDR